MRQVRYPPNGYAALVGHNVTGENPANTPINTVSTLPMTNGYGVGMRRQTKSAIVLLSGGIFTNKLTRARLGVAAVMEPINVPD
jgi:hypothetical protein